MELSHGSQPLSVPPQPFSQLPRSASVEAWAPCLSASTDLHPSSLDWPVLISYPGLVQTPSALLGGALASLQAHPLGLVVQDGRSRLA